MLVPIYTKMALSNLKTTKWRSLLTMLGVIIGVASVVTTVSIGEGVKQQVARQINHAGPDIITIRPGHVVARDKGGDISGVNLMSTFGGTTFNQADLATVLKTDNVNTVTAFSLVNGIPEFEKHSYDNGFVVATSDNLPEALNLKVAYGSFFSDDETNKDGAVIGRHVAERLFQENVPIGRAFTIRGQSFRVRGVLDDVPSSPLVPYSNYDDAVLISLDAGKHIGGGSIGIYQIIVQPKAASSAAVVSSITNNLQEAHAGQRDFTVLKGTETFAAANTVLKLLTSFVTGVAAVSLVVGGIGIMNIMLVSVTERTREIGIRKAVGATNAQILQQFLIEASVLSIGGGVIGIGVSLIINYVLRVTTSLQPVISLPIVGIATGVAVLVGIFFGIAPAVKAARKDPIESLRYI